MVAPNDHEIYSSDTNSYEDESRFQVVWVDLDLTKVNIDYICFLRLYYHPLKISKDYDDSRWAGCCVNLFGNACN